MNATRPVLTLGTKSKRIPQKETPTKIPRIKGKMEVSVKINALPNWVETLENNQHHLCLNANGQLLDIKLRHKAWQKVIKANEENPHWGANFTGQLGQRIENGFELKNVGVQTSITTRITF
ncbi:hypothetical protein [Candidatus Parabeggiatoa sp. HSG14]|uniref:hypothetical protein n=1 Tax=Candidatus Parabeggiatoa sp. HSG14 TaxID=3055593 RepID=UPI0025A7F0BB|nr:hypothetical protein [Thiotrichales bacterium HSG14]